MRSSSSPNVLPSASVRHRRSPARCTPAKTPEASIAGAKRVPSSLVQLTTTIGCFVLMPRSLSVRIDLEPAEHAEHAVIAAAGRLGVEMAADMTGGSAGVRRPRGGRTWCPSGRPPWSARRPRTSVWNSAPALGVVVGQRLAVVAAGNARPDLRHLMDGVPQPVAVDAEIVGGWAYWSVSRIEFGWRRSAPSPLWGEGGWRKAPVG